MKNDKIRKYLTELKLRLDEMDDYVRNAMDVIYEIENQLGDQEFAKIDACQHQKVYAPISMLDFFKDAATQSACPPRLEDFSRRSEYLTAAAGFYQYQTKPEILFNTSGAV